MKKIFFILGILMIAVTAYRCNSKVVPADGVLKGKLVIKEICSHFVVQVVNAKLDTAVVTNGLMNFFIRLTCTLIRACSFANRLDLYFLHLFLSLP